MPSPKGYVTSETFGEGGVTIKVMNNSEAITPMVKQYLDIKSQYKDAILMFRLGDFYEMFNDDAKTASRELDLTLTGRGSGDGRMPMCGVPYHAVDNYIAKLIDRGYKVAICDQVEDPKLAKGVVKREVVKLITPGTVQETKMLDEKSSNYLAALCFQKNEFGIAYIDASTGEFRITKMDTAKGIEGLVEEINRIHPSEILMPDIIPENITDISDKLKSSGYPLTTFKDTYDPDIARKKLKEQFQVVSLDSFGLAGFEAAFGAAAAILDYLTQTQKGGLQYINRIQPYRPGDFMFLDHSTRRNLEILDTARDRSSKGSLLWVIDSTSTPMGGRLLKKWLVQPLMNMKEIGLRHDAVEELSKELILRQDLSQALRSISDIERLIGKIASGACNGRDMIALRDSLANIPSIKHVLKGRSSAKIKSVLEMDEAKNASDIIAKAITDDPPHTIKEGGLIRKGFNEELDKIKNMTQGNKEWITQLEIKERQRSGIKSLKVGYTSVFGYYIEVSKSNLASIPQDYIRKQTLVNCERFITPELKDREALILNAEEKMCAMEYEIFQEVRGKLAAYTKNIQEISDRLAELDVLLSFASTAAERKYCRPKFNDGRGIHIKNGRHPVVEATIGENVFVPNDTDMHAKESRFLLITGPNMAGKSTFMRQTADICILAQTGSFVPASSAELPIIDRIFTRIGAMDDIYAGQSTFMVEMTETANIMNNATSKSLVILDEIGRGTSTFDGMSIAAAVSEYIHEKIKAFTLFATHYHEITKLAEKHPGMKNYNTLVKKEGDRVVFLHKIVEGAADQSYGIEVAKLAGLPEAVIIRAKEVYNTLAMVENVVASDKKKRAGSRDQTSLF